MAKNEKKGGSPKVENRCPVCGKFASKWVLDACKGMMSEVERTQREEIDALRNSVLEKTNECKKLHEIKKSYDNLIDSYNLIVDELNKLKVENERLRERGFFDYLFGRG